VNRGTMGVNSLPKTVTRQRRDCDLNPGPSAPESSTLTTRLPLILALQKKSIVNKLFLSVCQCNFNITVVLGRNNTVSEKLRF